MSSPVRNSKSGTAPKKYVGFQPKSNTSPETEIFQMDEDFSKTALTSTSQAEPSNALESTNSASSLAQNIGNVGPEIAVSSAAIPITGSPAGRPGMMNSAAGLGVSSRKLSFQSNIGSPPTKSFQERLFQRSPSQQQISNQSAGSSEDLSLKTSPRSSTLTAEIKQHAKLQQPSNLKHLHSKTTSEASISTSNQQQRPPSNSTGGDFQKGPPRKQMTKAERRELQERQRAEKAAKQGGTSGGPGNAGPSKPKPTNLTSLQSTSESNLAAASARSSATSKITGTVSSAGKKQYKKAQMPDPSAGKVVSLFAHLSQYDPEVNLTREKNAKGTVHPIVIQLGLQYSENMITGGNARCMALMLALKKVISDFTPAPGTSLLRTLTQHISKQVDYLSNSRSLATSMKTAIRFVKNEITGLDVGIPDQDAKKKLCDSISEFIDMRIIFSHNEIVQGLLKGNKIKDGDVILTFARSSIVSRLLIDAHTQGIQFRVIIVDSRPKLEGKDTLRELSSRGISCTYVMTNAIHQVIKDSTKVIIGASAVFSNGDVMSRIGTSVVAMAAHDARIPVMVLCEVYKFSDIVRLDSFVWNEIGDPEELVDISNRSQSERLPPGLQVLPFNTLQVTKSPALAGWKDIDNLKLLNLTYDITPAKFVTMVCCELGQIPSTLVLSVLRSQNQY